MDEDSSSQLERLDCSEPWSHWTHCANFIPPRGFYLTVFVQLILEAALGDVLYGRALGSRLKSPQTCYTRVLPVVGVGVRVGGGGVLQLSVFCSGLK